MGEKLGEGADVPGAGAAHAAPKAPAQAHPLYNERHRGPEFQAPPRRPRQGAFPP